MNIAALERDRDAKKQEGLALLARSAQTAEAENRAFTDEERSAIQAITEQGRQLEVRIAAARSDQAMLDDLTRLGSVTVGSGLTPAAAAARTRGRVLSLGEQFVASPEYEFFRKGLHRSSSTWRSPSVELADPRQGFHATTLTEDPASGGALVVPQYIPGIVQLPNRPLVVADLFAPGTTTSNLISYMQETAFTNAANAVLEGAAKPESALTFVAVQDPVRKIAHWLPVTEEMLEDVPQISSYINARLVLGVQIEEDDELLNGTGVAPELLGITKRAGLAADVVRVDPATNADAILAQIFAIYTSAFLMPDGIVMNPTNWAKTALAKSSTGEYIGAGPFDSGLQAQTLWGLPVAVTPNQLLGSGFVGAFKTAAQIFRKGGIRVEASNSHVDFFIKNLVAIRAEERLALAVYRPGAFGEVTGLQ
jgi:HK97 family phage major capsid protein